MVNHITFHNAVSQCQTDQYPLPLNGGQIIRTTSVLVVQSPLPTQPSPAITLSNHRTVHPNPGTPKPGPPLRGLGCFWVHLAPSLSFPRSAWGTLPDAPASRQETAERSRHAPTQSVGAINTGQSPSENEQGKYEPPPTHRLGDVFWFTLPLGLWLRRHRNTPLAPPRADFARQVRAGNIVNRACTI
jgi:hypothetical protein